MKLIFLIVLTIVVIFCLVHSLKGALNKCESDRTTHILTSLVFLIITGVLMFIITLNTGAFTLKSNTWEVKDIVPMGVIKVNRQHVTTLPPENVIYHEYDMKLTDGDRDTIVVYRCTSEIEPTSLIGKRIILHEK